MTTNYNINPSEKVFLDSTFLASFSIVNHPNFVNAQKLLAVMLANKCEMHTSIFCIYELWGVVKKINNQQNGNKFFRRKLNSYLEKVFLKILFNQRNFSYKEIHTELSDSIQRLQYGGYIRLRSLKPKHLNNALSSIDNFNMKPGDSYIYSSMNDFTISTIVTENQRDFNKDGMGLKVVWFK
jgi:hypothetical protein